jgi:hypothetical protein
MGVKFEREIKPPIEVLPGKDADKIGKHYAALHDAGTRDAYNKLGEKVVTTHQVERKSDGSAEVKIIEIHKK